MKVYVLISATAQTGKFREARKAAVDTVNYLQSNQDYVGEYEVVRPIGGGNNLVAWLCRYASMADYEKDMERRGKDTEWSRAFEPVNQTVDVDNITSETFQVLE